MSERSPVDPEDRGPVEEQGGPSEGADQEEVELHAILDLVEELERQLGDVTASNQAVKERLSAGLTGEGKSPGGGEPARPAAPRPLVSTFDWQGIPVLGIPEIDGDHRAIVGFIERFGRVCRENKGEVELFGALRWLVRYAERHFAREERLMEQIHHPARRAHREDHDRFMESLFDYNARLTAEGEPVAEELLGYLRGWLIAHVVEKDQLYVPLATQQLQGRSLGPLPPGARGSS